MTKTSIVGVLLLILSYGVHAETQLGKTYSISERSALDEINERAEGFKGLKDIDVKKTTAFAGHPLPLVDAGRERVVSPFYTLEFDIADENGKVIYPKGFTFNVAEYVSLPFRVIVFSEKQIETAKSLREENDIMLLSEGDIMEVKKELGGNVFYLDSRVADRLYVQAVPSLVEQKGANYVITEIEVKGDGNE